MDDKQCSQNGGMVCVTHINRKNKKEKNAMMEVMTVGINMFKQIFQKKQSKCLLYHFASASNYYAFLIWWNMCSMQRSKKQ